MKIIKNPMKILREDAHGGSGSRKLFLADNEIEKCPTMTYGFLSAGF